MDGMPPTKAMPLAKAAAQKALEIDSGLAEAYVSMALVKLSYDWDLPGAAQEFSRAMALNPVGATAHQWYSHYFMAAGDLGKATEEMQTALRLEPLSPAINLGIGWCFYYSREYDKAIEQYRAVLQMDSNYPTAHQTLGMAYQQKGMYAEAIDQFKMAVSLSGNGPAAVAGLASAYGAAGRAGEARQELARLEAMSRQRYVPALYMASVHEALGDKAASFRWGWKALGERSDYFVYLKVEPRAGKLRDHRRRTSQSVPGHRYPPGARLALRRSYGSVCSTTQRAIWVRELKPSLVIVKWKRVPSHTIGSPLLSSSATKLWTAKACGMLETERSQPILVCAVASGFSTLRLGMAKGVSTAPMPSSNGASCF
jgi:tetratricopeptide (TPR) repeat protein